MMNDRTSDDLKFERLSKLLASMPEIEVRPTFELDLRRRMAEERALKPSLAGRFFSSWQWRFAAVAAGACAVVALIVALRPHSESSRVASVPPSASQSVQADQPGIAGAPPTIELRTPSQSAAPRHPRVTALEPGLGFGAATQMDALIRSPRFRATLDSIVAARHSRATRQDTVSALRRILSSTK
jgi:hypothetical protein